MQSKRRTKPTTQIAKRIAPERGTVDLRINSLKSTHSQWVTQFFERVWVDIVIVKTISNDQK